MNTYLAPPFTHASTHCWSVIFLVPCSPSACFALHMASLIWPFHESAAIAGADVIATAAASAATIFRMHASSKKADFADEILQRMVLQQAGKSAVQRKKGARARALPPDPQSELNR